MRTHPERYNPSAVHDESHSISRTLAVASDRVACSAQALPPATRASWQAEYDRAEQGGEAVALARLKYYLWDSDLIADYFNSRNGMLGGDYSTKFSPWLALGCLSPRTIYHEIQKCATILCRLHTFPAFTAYCHRLLCCTIWI